MDGTRLAERPSAGTGHRDYRLALFDFDGTLADSFPFFLSVFNTVAAEHGFRGLEPSAVPGLRHCSAREMMRHVGLPAWKLPRVAGSFKALMQVHAERIPLFPGIAPALRQLAGAGVRLAVVSSNSPDNVRRILGPEIVGLIGHYECGMSIFGKASRIRKVLRQSGIPSRQAIYVGDQLTDFEAARREGVAFGAVAWGYAALESLAAQSPDMVFAEVAELLRIAPAGALPLSSHEVQQ